jgi:hypothetical protein
MDNIADAIQGEADKARLKNEIAQLKRDLAAITKTLADKGAKVFDDLTEDDDEDPSSTAHMIKRRGIQAAGAIGHQAKRIGDIPTQNSISTLVMIAGLGVIIGMLATRP